MIPDLFISPRIGFQIEKNECFFKPKPDITSYEVALCLGALIAISGGGNPEKYFDPLPDEAKRHFELKDG